jgi:hypothetical protein
MTMIIVQEVECIPLRVGDILQPGDFYLSTTGKWESIPCPGLEIQFGSAAQFVRPNTPSRKGS